MSHRIIIERAGGAVAVMQISDETWDAIDATVATWAAGQDPRPSPEAIAARMAALGQAVMAAEVRKWEAGTGETAVSWREGDVAELPADRVFRDAWHHADGKVAVHMERARGIHLGRIREARDRQLDELDTAYMRADERADHAGKRAIATRKQALRDLPATLDLAQHATPEALHAAWPEGLPRPPA
jgi:hypothetical protein